MARVQESDEPAKDEVTAKALSQTQPSETGLGEFSEVVKDLEHSMGLSRRYNPNEETAKRYFVQEFSYTNKVPGTVDTVKTFNVEKWSKSTAKLEDVWRESRILRKV